MSGEGWIKLYRQLLDSRAFHDPVLLKVWIWCLLKASHKEQFVLIRTGRGMTTVSLKPGEFLFGRHQGSKELSLSPSTLYRKIQCLCVLAMIALKPDTHFSIVTILNWETFQGEWTGNRTPNGHPKNTYKNDKNVKKKPPDEISSEISLLTDKLFSSNEGKELFTNTIKAISSTRKTNRVSPSVILKLLQDFQKYSEGQILTGMKTYLEKGYHTQGKKEPYLLGIIRNLKSDPSPTPEPKSTGSSLLDAYYRKQDDKEKSTFGANS